MQFTEKLKDGRNFAKDPAVVHYNGKYFLYYSTYTEDGRLTIGVATSMDLENFQTVSHITGTQECEKKGVGAPCAIVINGLVHMFYQTYGNGEKDAICHAVSNDGINFVKDKTNPVFKPTDDWCIGRAIDADVVEFNGKLFMYFATRDHKMITQKIGVACADVKSDFSRSAWKQAKPSSVISPELIWEGDCIEAPATIVVDNKIYMFYGGSYNCTPQQIGVAVSKCGIYFERVFNAPFIKNGKKGEWNESESGHPYVFRDDDGKVYLFYQGSPDGGKTWILSKCRIDFKDGKPFVIKEK